MPLTPYDRPLYPNLRPLATRVDNAERGQRDATDPRRAGRVQAELEAVFSHAGTPVTTASARWYPRRTARLYRVVVSLATAGTSNTVVTVYVNGGSQGTVTLASGVNRVSAAFDNVLAADADWLTVAATTVGAGAKDLTVQARLS